MSAADTPGAALPPLRVPLPVDAAPGIYVHVPFCRHICPYCDFNTYAGQEQRIPAYVEALAGEMVLLAASDAAATSQATTLFFGGGTPSLLSGEQVAWLIAAARAHLGLLDDAEVSLEANPEGLTAETLHALRAAGVNRLSIGAQTQQRAGLRVLGRNHQAVRVPEALAAARQAGFDNISVDFIYGWPGQTLDDWQRDLEVLAQWDLQHVSLYSLIVEPGTPMHVAVQRGILQVPDDDASADMYDMARAFLADAGWEHYEISNWARTPQHRSRHNQIYWQNGAYHGLGAGAYGRGGTERYSNLLAPAAYITAVREGRLPRVLHEPLSADISTGETMMLGLRLLIDGVDAADFSTRHGVDLAEHFAAPIARFEELGLLEWHTPDEMTPAQEQAPSRRLRLTARGALLANSVCAEFLP